MAGPAWPQIFRQFIVSNSRYWLNCAQNDIKRLWPEFPQVLQALNYGLSLPEAWEPSRDLLLWLSPLIVRRGWGAEWEGFLRQGIARSPKERDPAEIDLRLHLGNLYRLQGRLAEAKQCFQEVVSLYDHYHSKALYCTLLNHLALVARLAGQHEEALTYCRQVLEEQNPSSSEQAEALNVLGLVAYDRRQWSEALAYFEQALALYRGVGDSYQIARILTNQGVVLQRSGRLDEAEARCQEAIQQFQTADDQIEIYKAMMNLGNVLLMRQAYEAAIKQYQVTLPIFKQFHFLIDLGNIYNNLGMAYSELADWPAAEAYFTAALDLAYKRGNSYYLANLLDNFGTMLIKAGQYGRAREVLSQALETLNSASHNPASDRLWGVVEDRLVQLQARL